MPFDVRLQSVRHLASLYTVILGVALSSSIYQLLGSGESGLVSLRWAPVLLFSAFLITVFPFYHGAMRHLDDTYLADDRPEVRSFALLFDFALLFAHGLLFVVLSLLLEDPVDFALVFGAILGLDVVWAVIAHLGFSPDTDRKAETWWAIINAIAVVALIALWRVDATFLHWAVTSPIDFCGAVLIISVVRTVVDYRLSWDFYFPS